MDKTNEWTTSNPTVDRWHTETRHQGQMVEYSYGYDEDGELWDRRVDRSEGVTEYRRVS